MICKTRDSFCNEFVSYGRFLSQYKSTQKKFVDRKFHPYLKIQESEEIQNYLEQDVEWKRVDEVYKAPLLDKDLIKMEYIQQGLLKDCYLISLFVRIARQPELVSKLFDHTPDIWIGVKKQSINLESGAIAIFFYAYGQEIPVVIDTLLPFKKTGNNEYELLFSHPKEKSASPWFCLVEKAFAKLYGSYSNIEIGSFSSAVYSLFGYQPFNFDAHNISFQQIRELRDQGCIMDCSIQASDDDQKYKDACLIPNHSYLIEQAVQYEDKFLYRLINPWGRVEWNGDYSDQSDKWTKSMKKALRYKEEDDGIFWMDHNDFTNYFSTVDIARPIPKSMHSKTVCVIINPNECKKNTALSQLPNYVLEITDDVPENEVPIVDFILERRPFFDKEVKFIDDEISKVHLILCFSGKRRFTSNVINSKNFKKYRCEIEAQVGSLHQEIRDENGKCSPLTFVVRRVNKKEYSEYCFIRVSSKYNFDLYEIGSEDNFIQDDDGTRDIFKTYFGTIKQLPSNCSYKEKKLMQLDSKHIKERSVSLDMSKFKNDNESMEEDSSDVPYSDYEYDDNDDDQNKGKNPEIAEKMQELLAERDEITSKVSELADQAEAVQKTLERLQRSSDTENKSAKDQLEVQIEAKRESLRLIEDQLNSLLERSEENNRKIEELQH